MHFNFQFPKQRKLKFNINFQFPIPKENELKFDINFQFSQKMKIEIWMAIFKFLFFDSHIGPCFLLPVHESQRKPKSNNHRKTKNNQSQGMQGKCSRAFVCLARSIASGKHGWRRTSSVFPWTLSSAEIQVFVISVRCAKCTAGAKSNGSIRRRTSARCMSISHTPLSFSRTSMDFSTLATFDSLKLTETHC